MPPPAQASLYEITSSQLIVQSTADPKVCQFAQMMIAHSMKSTADMKAAAARSRVDAPLPTLNPLPTELVAELQAETGPAVPVVQSHIAMLMKM